MVRLNAFVFYKQQILASLLLVYHFLIWSDTQPEIKLAASFILYGLFLLWQPIWQKDRPVQTLALAVLLSAILLITRYFQNEVLVFFGLLLCGLIGSRLLSQTPSRPFDLLALLIITLEMIVGLVPDTFRQITLPVLFADYMQTLVLIPILIYFLAPNQEEAGQQGSQADLMHGLLAATLIFIVLLGGIVINQLYLVDYLEGLLLTVFLVSTLAIGISWFWNPGVGYTGLRALWNRYTLTIGGPFESWINTLTTLIEETYLSPVEFLQTACDYLIENDWLNAIEWHFPNFDVKAGNLSGQMLNFKLTESVDVDLYFKSDPGRALEQHTYLLVRMAYQFYVAKENQEKIRAQEHFATIHHTGARLTHDIKNILQSIKTSLGIIASDNYLPNAQKLLEKNLSQISERLESTLEKLKTPYLNTQVRFVSCQQWLDRLRLQHQANARIQVTGDIENNINIPEDLFDGVTENLVSNGLSKSPDTQVHIRLHTSTDVVLLSVCDDGEPIREEIRHNLFNKPVSSGSGMGIGLYQSAIMAHAFSFELELGGNEAGKVCFNLYQHLGD